MPEKGKCRHREELPGEKTQKDYDFYIPVECAKAEGFNTCRSLCLTIVAKLKMENEELRKCLDPECLDYFDQVEGKITELETALSRMKERASVECQHDWYVEPTMQPVPTTNVLQGKKWRCKKCLITRETYD
jgi:hypothetical protein